MDTEALAVSFVTAAIGKTDYLVPQIVQSDTGPSWDGHIEVYKTAADKHKKCNLYEKVPVQIKGHQENPPFPDKIKFSADVSDLENYLNIGGTLFFVAYMDEEGEEKRIYYASLLPFSLKEILKECHEDQQTKVIELKPLPTKKAKITNVVLNFAQDMRKQRASIHTELITVDTIAKDGNLEGLSLEFIDMDEGEPYPLRFLFEHDTYLYAQLPYNVEIPVQHLCDVQKLTKKCAADVCVGAKKFYSEFETVFTKDRVELTVGKSMHLINDMAKKEGTLSFRLRGTLSQRIADLKFLIEVLENKKLSIAGVDIPIEQLTSQQISGFELDKQKSNLASLQSLKNMLDSLKIQTDLDMDHLTKHDWQMLSLLFEGIQEQKEIPLADPGNPFGKFVIGNLTILVAIKKNNQSGLYRIYNFFDSPYTLKATSVDGTEFATPVCMLLEAKILEKASNLDFEKIFQDIVATPFSEPYANQVIWFSLRCLLAYDASKMKDVRFLHLTHKLFQWLQKVDRNMPSEIYTLNLLQITKRERDLTKEEMAQLYALTEKPDSTEDVKTAAYLLLDNQNAAEFHYEKMSPDQRRSFAELPIYHFWKR